MATSSPRASASRMAANTASAAFVAVSFPTGASAATRSPMSDFLMPPLPGNSRTAVIRASPPHGPDFDRAAAGQATPGYAA